MPHLNLDLDYFEHRKTKRLIGLLGRGAEVLPIKLWRYCGKYHSEDGRLTGYSKAEIESAVEWWGKEGEMVDAMKTVGVLDLEGDTYVVHDFVKEQGHIAAFKERAKTANEVRWKKIRHVSNKDAPSIPKESVDSPPNQRTKPTYLTNDPPTTRRGVVITESLRTEEFIDAWWKWETHLQQKSVKTTELADEQQIAKCAKWGPGNSALFILHSISGNYQGIFPPKGSEYSESPAEFARRNASRKPEVA